MSQHLKNYPRTKRVVQLDDASSIQREGREDKRGDKLRKGNVVSDLPWRYNSFPSGQTAPLESLLPFLTPLRIVSSEELLPLS